MNEVKKMLEALGGYAKSSILPTLLIVVAGILLVRLIMKIVTRTLEKTKMEKAAHSLIKTAIRVTLYVLLFLTAASKLGIDVTGVVALASVLTLAISLSVQNALTNVMGGFTLLYTKPFSSGDYVEIAGQSGTVQEIGLAYTRLATPDNKNVYIPNSAVTAAQIINYSTSATRRVDFNITASYDAPLPKVKQALLVHGPHFEEQGLLGQTTNSRDTEFLG